MDTRNLINYGDIKCLSLTSDGLIKAFQVFHLTVVTYTYFYVEITKEFNEQVTDQHDKVPSYMQQNFPNRATFWTDNEERTKIQPKVFK